MNGYAYFVHLGSPVLGLEETAELVEAANWDTAVQTISNPGDALHYLMEMEPFTDSRAACEAFVQLLEDDYSDYGYITLYGNKLRYSLVYLNYNGYYHPIDVFHVVNQQPSWIMASEDTYSPKEDPNILCESLADTFPTHSRVESWIMESFTKLQSFDNPTKDLYPWELNVEILGPENVAALFEAGDHHAAQRAITTVADAISYIKLMDPKTWNQSPMQGSPAWKELIYMLADDYEDVGFINLMKRKPEHREGFYDQTAYFGGYILCYVKQDDIYYPIDIICILKGWTSWTMLPKNQCYSSDDLEVLCKNLADTYANPQEPQMTYWETTSYMYHNGTKMIPVDEYVIPEGLGKPLLSDDEIDALVQETDYEIIAEKITTLGDALNFYGKLRLTEPKYRIHNQVSPFYYQSAWQVLKDKTGSGTAPCSLTRYLLKEDYDEIGYVLCCATTVHGTMMYIYEDGLYYLLYAGIYTSEPREDLWMEWPHVIGCAKDFKTIADSAVEHMWCQDPKLSECMKAVYLIRSEGDFVYGFDWSNGNIPIFPEGTEVVTYHGPEPIYAEAKLNWQSQTRIDK